MGGEDERSLAIAANEALLELKHHAGGPVHINLITNYDLDFSVRDLPHVPVIQRICYGDLFPEIPRKSIVISIRNNVVFDRNTIDAIETFCNSYDAVIISEDVANLKTINEKFITSEAEFIVSNGGQSFLLIHLGQDNTEFSSLNPDEVWSVSCDGEIIDLYRKLTSVFEMKEEYFFNHFNMQPGGLADEKTENNSIDQEQEKLKPHIAEEELYKNTVARKTRRSLFEKLFKR